MQVQELVEMMHKDGYSDEVIEAASHMYEKVEGHPDRIGDSDVVGGFWMETHTLGCRREANEPEATVFDAHWAIYDEYKGKADQGERVYGDPEDGIFFTVGPTIDPDLETANANKAPVVTPVPRKRKPGR